MTPPPIPRSSPTPSGLAIASLALGALALLCSLLLIGAFFGLIGIVLGLLHLTKPSVKKTMAGWGVGLSIAGVLASLGAGLAYVQLYQHLPDLLTGNNLTSWEGEEAPDFTVTTLKGNSITLSELRGKRVIVDLWATWCGPCVNEIPHFIKLMEETSRDELVMIGVSKESESKLKDFVREQGINYPIASEKTLPSPYSDVTGIPTTFFIDREGIIESILVGYHDYSHLKSEALPEALPADPDS